MKVKKSALSRRAFITKSTAASAAIATGSLVTNADLEAIAGNVNTNSQPSQLKITDMRLAGNIVRLDTNQGISGYGNVRGSTTYALFLKSRLLGMNPCNVDKIFRKIKQFGHHGRQAAGVCAVEMACWDLAGKSWGVPVWQMLGGKFRDSICMYVDTKQRQEIKSPDDKQPSTDPVVQGEWTAERLKERMNWGYKFLKMDFSIGQLQGIEGCITAPVPLSGRWLFGNGYANDPYNYNQTAHPFKGIRISEKGLTFFKEFWTTIRDIVGWEIPIATDHYGHLLIEDCIKLARTVDPFNLAWLEDMVPWMYTDQLLRLKNSCTTPICTGEDIYLKEGFMDLFTRKAIAICHPDLQQTGGILETKKIGDLAMEHGISMAIHCAATPVAEFASVHCAAATENFLAMEKNGADNPNYYDIIKDIPEPVVQDGFIKVPDGPGLGFDLNEDGFRRMLERYKGRGRGSDGYFEPTPEWDNERSGDRLWSMYISKGHRLKVI